MHFRYHVVWRIVNIEDSPCRRMYAYHESCSVLAINKMDDDGEYYMI